MRYVCVLLLLCYSAFSQNSPRAEVFVGYSFLSADANDLTTSRQKANGGDFSFVANMNRWVGLETNFSGYYKSVDIGGTNVSLRDFNIGFGPRLRYKWAFVHGLAGIDDLGASVLGHSDTNGAFVGLVGAGVIFKFSRFVGLEGTGDYAFSRHNLFLGPPFTQHNFRATAGIVFTFGQIGGRQSQSRVPRIPDQHTRREVPAGSATAAGPEMVIPTLGLSVVSREANAGALISDVAPNSVAALAGLHPDDVINAVNGVPVKTPTDLAAALSGVAPGATVRLGYMIRGEWQTETTIVVGKR